MRSRDECHKHRVKGSPVWHAALCTLWVGILCCLAGCGGGPTKPKEDIFPVTGVVRYKGEVLSEATVAFVPKGDTMGFTGQARTDKDGRYHLVDMHGNKCMVAGEYSVTVSRRVLPGGAVVPADDKTPPIESQASETLPPHISNAERSSLVVVVTKEKMEYNLDLK